MIACLFFFWRFLNFDWHFVKMVEVFLCKIPNKNTNIKWEGVNIVSIFYACFIKMAITRLKVDRTNSFHYWNYHQRYFYMKIVWFYFKKNVSRVSKDTKQNKICVFWEPYLKCSVIIFMHIWRWHKKIESSRVMESTIYESAFWVWSNPKDIKPFSSKAKNATTST